jgi:uncharacterized repeat protein (TIGR03803 family)
MARPSDSPSSWTSYLWGGKESMRRILLAVAASVLVSAGSVSAQPYFDVLHVFDPTTEGTTLAGALIQGTDGDFYGTTTSGGPLSFGTVFKMTPRGSVTILHAFAGGADGARPGSLMQAADGSFYGTTFGGGAYGAGTIFRMTANGFVTILHTFLGGDGVGGGPLVQATDGNFYGIGGGTGNYGVFRITPGGTFTVLHGFTGTDADGACPGTTLVQATDGNFYGTTSGCGGASNSHNGTIYKITPSGALTVLSTFAGTGISIPIAPLIQAADGNFYGTTQNSSHPTVFGQTGPGAIFKMTPDGAITVLHTFGGSEGFATSWGPLIQAKDGNFYGTTSNGGPSGSAGTIFKMTPDGTVTSVHAFMGVHVNDPGHPGDPGYPSTALIQASDGSFYGTAAEGDPFASTRVVFRVGAAPLVDQSFTADFDGDRKSDMVVYRPTTGLWYVRASSTGYSEASATSYQWGTAGDIPLVADFDGDGKTDLIVYRPATGVWYVRLSSSGYANWTAYQWGAGGAGLDEDVPLVGDFDGDGKADLVVYRPTTGVWYVCYSGSSYGTASAFQWGTDGDIPLAGDFDGDGKTDVTVYRPSTGVWYVLASSSHYTSWTAYQWGTVGDIPLVTDFDGDGRADVTVYRPSTGVWYVLTSSSHYRSWTGYLWGAVGDIPLATDFDGDGKTDATVYRASTGVWYVLASSGHYTSGTTYQWGTVGDIPATDFDGDGKTDLSVWRPSTRRW